MSERGKQQDLMHVELQGQKPSLGNCIQAHELQNAVYVQQNPCDPKVVKSQARTNKNLCNHFSCTEIRRRFHHFSFYSPIFLMKLG